MFQENVIRTINSLDWWKSQADRLNLKTNEVVIQLLTAKASSAGVERVFSSFGLVHSKLRNQLGIEKAGKLVFLLTLLNKTPLQLDDEVDEDTN